MVKENMAMAFATHRRSNILPSRISEMSTYCSIISLIQVIRRKNFRKYISIVFNQIILFDSKILPNILVVSNISTNVVWFRRNLM